MQGQDTERYNDGFSWIVYCAHCNKSFEAKRSDASYCSPACRVAAHREPKKLELELIAFQAFARKVVTFSIRYRRSKKVYEVVLDVYNLIGKALANFETE